MATFTFNYSETDITDVRQMDRFRTTTVLGHEVPSEVVDRDYTRAPEVNLNGDTVRAWWIGDGGSVMLTDAYVAKLATKYAFNAALERCRM